MHSSRLSSSRLVGEPFPARWRLGGQVSVGGMPIRSGRQPGGCRRFTGESRAVACVSGHHIFEPLNVPKAKASGRLVARSAIATIRGIPTRTPAGLAGFRSREDRARDFREAGLRIRSRKTRASSARQGPSGQHVDEWRLDLALRLGVGLLRSGGRSIHQG